jgi:hypothetical protein
MRSRYPTSVFAHRAAPPVGDGDATRAEAERVHPACNKQRRDGV